MSSPGVKRRELALIALIVLAVGMPVLYRYRLKPARIAAETAEADFRTIVLPADESNELESAARQKRELSEKLEELKRSINQLSAASIQADDVHKLRLEVSSLAATTGLKVREIVFPFTVAADKAPARVSDASRARLKLNADATFAELSAFVHGLAGLGKEVRVLQFELASDVSPKTAEQNASSRLSLMVVLEL